MAGALNTLVFNGSRRIRVLCTQALASGAFTATAIYSVANVDGLGASPDVDAVFAIANTPQAFELAVDCDLVPGSIYAIAVDDLPFADSSTYTGILQGRVAAAPNTPDPQGEPATGDLDLYFYGRDLLQGDDGDWALDPTGDLATIQGRPNWLAANERGCLSDGVPWNAAYGAKPSLFVNAPAQQALPLSSRLVAQCLSDDRTASASVQLVTAPGATLGNPSGAPTQFEFETAIDGRDGLGPTSFNTPIPARS